MPLNRRDLIKLTAAASGVLVASSCGSDGGGPKTIALPKLNDSPLAQLKSNPFTLGVAAGDMLNDAAVVWTRLVPAETESLPDANVELILEVSDDAEFTNLVSAVVVEAIANCAFAVHHDVQGLSPLTRYWYRFSGGDHQSPIGSFRTLPSSSGTEAYRFVLATCQEFQTGRYAAWRDAAKQGDLDSVIFTGDYIYELPPFDLSPTKDGTRVWPTPPPKSLDEFRARYAAVKSDPAIQEAHAATGWFMMWDDHEITDNYYKDGGGQLSLNSGDFKKIQQAAYKAWWEHQPVRGAAPTEDGLKVYRLVDLGSLGQMYLLDARQYADEPPCRDTSRLDFGEECLEMQDPDRQILGEQQQNWLIDALGNNKGTWSVMVSPGMFAGLDARESEDNSPNPKRYLESWDGYPVAREKVADALAKANGPVVLSGDYHAAFVLDVGPGFQHDPICPEFMTAAITSVPFAADVTQRNPHVQYFNPDNGYILGQLTNQKLTVEFKEVKDIWNEDSVVTTVAKFSAKPGDKVATKET